MNILKSLSVRVLIALAAGLAIGALVNAYGGSGVRAAVEGFEAVGVLWLNALRMTVIPLIFAVLVTGIAKVSDAAATGRTALRAVSLFAVILVFGCVYTLAATHGLLALWPVDPGAAAALKASVQAGSEPTATAPDFAAWLKGLAPSNPIKAAAEDAVLPLVVFAVFTGFALTRLAPERGRPVIDVIDAIGEAMIVIVRWVLWAGPIGVFALALGVGLRAGAGAAGVLGHYIAVVSLVGLGVGILAYLAAVTIGRAPLGRWARATAPVLAAAFATQSSLACLPAMIERMRDEMDVPERIADLVLPLAVAVFRLTSPVMNLAVVIFLTQLYGVEPTPIQWVGAVLVALAVGIGSVGLPGQVSFIVSVAPICIALGVPIELLPILLAVEVAPDIFRTLGNVTGDMAVTQIVARQEAAPRQA